VILIARQRSAARVMAANMSFKNGFLPESVGDDLQAAALGSLLL
jgi:hypothetical protein